MRLKDQVAIVTGGSRGIGAEIAGVLAGEGADVIIADLRAPADGLPAAAEFVKCDVRSPGECESVVTGAMERRGGIDILVNNAGVARDALTLTMDRPDWDEVIETNLGGVFNFTRLVAPYMLARKRGRIINISSIASRVGGKGQSNYAASKAAIEAFTRSVALELAPKGITVNAVAPGLIETEMSLRVRELAGSALKRTIPMRRYGTPGDVAAIVLFLALPEASYITAQTIAVDGGLAMAGPQPGT